MKKQDIGVPVYVSKRTQLLNCFWYMQLQTDALRNNRYRAYLKGKKSKRYCFTCYCKSPARVYFVDIIQKPLYKPLRNFSCTAFAALVSPFIFRA